MLRRAERAERAAERACQNAERDAVIARADKALHDGSPAEVHARTAAAHRTTDRRFVRLDEAQAIAHHMLGIGFFKCQRCKQSGSLTDPNPNSS